MMDESLRKLFEKLEPELKHILETAHKVIGLCNKNDEKHKGGITGGVIERWVYSPFVPGTKTLDGYSAILFVALERHNRVCVVVDRCMRGSVTELFREELILWDDCLHLESVGGVQTVKTLAKNRLRMLRDRIDEKGLWMMKADNFRACLQAPKHRKELDE